MSEPLELEDVRNEDRNLQNLSESVRVNFQQPVSLRRIILHQFSEDFLEIPEINGESHEEELRSLSSPSS